MSDTATLSRLFSGIEEDLEIVDRTFAQHASSDLAMLNTAVDYVLGSPGKRLRTALALLSGKLIEYRFEKLLPLSVSLEMVHLATLVHDDIVDNARTRRGKPTVNAKYGDGVAILLGDYLFAKTAGLVAEVEDFALTGCTRRRWLASAREPSSKCCRHILSICRSTPISSESAERPPASWPLAAKVALR